MADDDAELMNMQMINRLNLPITMICAPTIASWWISCQPWHDCSHSASGT
jgi:hypothetical protein